MLTSMAIILIIALSGIFMANINVYVGIIILTLIFIVILYFVNMYLYKNQNNLANKIM